MAFYTDVNSYNPTTTPLLRDVETIYQSLNNILNTRYGERLFDPEFGTGVTDELFETFSDEDALEIMRLVVSSIETYEPRVTLDYSQTKIVSLPEEHRFELDLYFKIANLPDNDNVYNLRGAFTR